jgi:hypothetical protein
MNWHSGGGPLATALAIVGIVAATGSCTTAPQPPTTTTTTTAVTTTTTAPGHGHEEPKPDAPYISPDDPRLTPEQRQRAKDLIARTQVGMQRFPNELSLILAGYTSIRDSDSGYEHYINWSLLEDGKELDAGAIEAVVLEVKPGQAKRVVAAMYILSNGKTMDDVPEVAGPLTPWHNHKDLCWDPSGRFIMGVFRLGRCIPWGTLRELNPMLHVWITPNPCGPFAEVDDMNGLVDQWLRSTGQLPPKPPSTGCAHVHGGDHS